MTPPPSEVPRKIGRYEIQRELGRGTMGVVYEARDPALGRSVALKTIRPAFGASEKERATYEKRFMIEAQVAAQLSHPGIVVVHDVGRDAESGVLYIALEYLVGKTLDEGVAATAKDWRETLRIVAKVAVALHHAHGKGVVHRDIKPANIMVLKSGEPKIMDFGIAKLESSNLTTTGQFFGTPLYMAPEQVSGGPIDGRTDIFSLGSVLYTLLTGKQPFKADSVPVILARVSHQNPPPPSKLASSLPADVDYCVARCMAKVPGDRYPDGHTLAEDIEDILAGRPPRHRGNWKAPEVGEGTLVAQRPELPAEVLDLLPLEDGTVAPKPAASKGAPAAPKVPAIHRPLVKGSRLVALFAGTLLVAGAGLFAAAFFFQAIPPDILSLFEPAPRGTSAPPGTVASPVPTSAPSAATESTPPEAEVTATAETGASVATPEASATEPPATEPPATTTPESTPKARGTEKATDAEKGRGRLAIDFEHHLKSGTLKVWVDDVLVADESLDSRVTKKIRSFRVGKGKRDEVVNLTAGRHKVRVDVRWDKKVESRSITRTFKADTTHRLQVRVSRFTGNLSLEWK